MATDDIKRKIAQAEESVKEIKDEALRVKAFEVILNNLLIGKQSPSTAGGSAIPRKEDTTEKSQVKLDPNSLVVALGTDFEKLKSIIDFSETDFHIIGNVAGSTEGEKQRNATLLVLTVHYHCVGDREIPSGSLKKILQDLGITSLINLATNLKASPSFIVRIGEQGSTATKYRITNPGIQEGLRLMKTMIAIAHGQSTTGGE